VSDRSHPGTALKELVSLGGVAQRQDLVDGHHQLAVSNPREQSLGRSIEQTR
jgi:hypothetical protein